MALNKAVVTGKIIEEPQTRYTNSDEGVTRLLLETGDGVNLRLACWRDLAEKAKELKEGDQVLVTGTLITSSYKTNSGQNRKDFELNVRDLYLLPGELKNLNPSQYSAGKPTQVKAAPKKEKVANAEEDLSDILLAEEEIPF
jgi:single-stranded DNA-binding protein